MRGFGKGIFYTVVFLAVIATISFYIKNSFFNPSFVLYKEFGIYMPVNYTIHGIDVSRHQQDISWRDVKQMKANNMAIGFAFIKATEGIDDVDAKYRSNMANAKQGRDPKRCIPFFYRIEKRQNAGCTFCRNSVFK